MNAAAFIIASWTGIPYINLVFIGFTPALLYYFGIMLSAYIRTLKMGDEEFKEEVMPEFKSSFISLLVFLVPLVVLVGLMVMGESAQKSLVYSILCMLVVGLVQQFIEKEEKVFRKPWEKLFLTIKPYPDLREVLEMAKDSGYILGALSDFPVGVKLKALGIDDLFTYKASTEEYGALKPSRRPFDMMLKELGLKAEETLYTGDSRHKDMDGAKNAGMHTALISRSVRVYNNADIIFSSWKEFGRVVL